MTWTGWFTVDSVVHTRGILRWVVELSASADAQVTPFKDDPRFAELDEADRLRPTAALTSNTEGKLVSAHLTLQIDSEHPPVDVGDVIYLGGHFGPRKIPDEEVAAASDG